MIYDDGITITNTYDQVGNRLIKEVTVLNENVPISKHITQDDSDDID